ncbi:NAD(P)/FAD-dependent oxidoreductase [Candidatus Spongiihabitans sp.]|uniref:NAD(P)/FAD-dependent oxidoreductase n=1 Tax=Candidatus Spongiihabitans sp. TaxID=3101308 RepID=UPI003C7A93CC
MKYLIIGAGPAGVVAAETLRKLDASAEITIIGDEPEPPYSRMAIPYLLSNNIDEPGTHLRKQAHHFKDSAIEVVVDTVKSVDPSSKKLLLTSGGSRAYDKLLVATGSRPVTPPIAGIEHEKVTSCWNLKDARKIASGLKPGASVVLIGAGFIGCIILEALVSSGANLTVIEMGNRMVPRMLDETCGSLLEKWCQQKGVNVMTSSQVEAIESAADNVNVKVSGGREVEAELVISAAGVSANAAFLEGSGVRLADGAVVIDEYMCSSVADIYAAGDVACGKDFSTGEYTVQAIQPTAVEHGRVAANNMFNHGSVCHQGSVLMNVLDTIGLISTSYGQWEGVKGGQSATLVDQDNFRYIQLQFDDDRLVGVNTLGLTQHIGVLRGLVQGRFKLGQWKDKLMNNPLLVMEAYLATTQG